MSDVPIQFSSPEEVSRLLAERLRACRLHLGWKQSTLADRSGVSLPTVKRYERTGRTSLGKLLALSFALGRLDEFAELLKPAKVQSLAELEAESSRPGRKRGTR